MKTYKQAQLLDRLEINLSEEREAELSRWIDRNKDEIDTDRTEFVDRSQKYLQNWDDFVTFTRKGPWENSSNLHMPLTAIMVKTYHARLYNIFASENTTQFIPREATDESTAAMVKRLRDWYMWDYINGHRGIRGFIREIFYDCVTVGFGLGMKDWHMNQRKIIAIERKALRQEMKDLAPQIAEASKAGTEIQTTEEMEKNSVDVRPYKEVEKIITVFEGSRLRTIPFENMYFPNGIPESSDLDAPPCVIVETEMDVSEIFLRAAQGEWPESKAEAVREEPPAQYTGTRSQEIKEQRDRLSGYNEVSAQETKKGKRVIQYVFCRYDIDDDGIDEELVVIRSEKGTILKMTYLDRISKCGMRPLYKFDCFSKPRQAYSRGVPEFMYPMNEEMDNLHNMRIDYMALQTCPFGVYRGSSSLKSQPIRVSPGLFIPVDDTSDLRTVSFPASASVLVGEEERLWQYAERMTSTSPINQGMVPSSVGPLRSTSGVLSLLREMDKEFRVTVEQCAEQWRKLEKMLIDDLDRRIDPMVKMKVLGASAERMIKVQSDEEALEIANAAMMVGGQFDVKIDVANVIQSEEIRRNEAQLVLQTASAPSLLQQMGVVTPQTLYKAVCDFLRAYGRDPDNYVDKPEYVNQPLSLFQEVQICGQRMMPPMSLKDDHEKKAAMLLAYMQQPEYLDAKAKGLFCSDVDDYMLAAGKKHSALADMLKPQNLPNPSGANGPTMNDTLAGVAPQQGGGSPYATTSRDLAPAESAPAGAAPVSEGGENAV